MLYPILPGALHQDYEGRVTEWRDKRRPLPLDDAVGLDFADVDRQRYLDTVVTHRWTEQPSTPPRRLWDHIRCWRPRRWTRHTA